MLPSIKELKQHIKEVKPEWKIVNGKNLYFTVKDELGYSAYVQADSFGTSDDPTSFLSISVSTRHLPNKKTGSGHNIYKLKNSSLSGLIDSIKDTLLKSKISIQSGREKMNK